MTSQYLAYSLIVVVLPVAAIAQALPPAPGDQDSSHCPFCGHRKALVIGNDHYDIAPLKNAINDSVGISEKLTKLGFETTLVNDVDLSKMEYAIEHFVVTLDRGDVALFFYSGHGFQIDGDNYLVPISFNAKNEADAKYSAYPMSLALDSMGLRKTAINILIVDACRNFPFAHARSLQKGLAPMATGFSSFLAYSTAPGMTADDNPSGVNGLFTKHLLAELETSATVPIEDLFTRVRKDVYSESGGAQVPWVASSVIGEFMFSKVESSPSAVQVSVPASAPEPAPAPVPESAPEPLPPTSAAVSTLKRETVDNSAAGVALPAGPRTQLGNMEAEGSKAVSSDPADVAGYMIRARARLSLGQFENAISDLSHALSLKPDYIEASRERGRLYLAIGRAAQAKEDLSLCLRSTPQDLVALYYRSLANVMLNLHDAAIRDTTELIRLAPSFAEAYVSRGSAYLLKGKVQEAISDCSDALRLNPNLSSALSLRGKALQTLGRSVEAQRDFSFASLAKRRALVGASLPGK